MRLGIIGTGQIGGMLATAFAKTKLPQLMIINRTSNKAEILAQAFPEQIQVADSMESIIVHSDYLFLCLKSPDTRNWLAKWGGFLDDKKHLIITSSQIALAELEAQTSAQVAKVIPSITQASLSGYILYSLGPRTDAMTVATLLLLLSRIGIPLAIAENDARIYADLTSCGPAFFATIIQQMAAAAKQKGVPQLTAESLIVEMMAGLVKLIKDNGYRLQDVIQKVSVPGGVTEAGVIILNQATPAMFTELFDATARRHRELGSKH